MKGAFERASGASESPESVCGGCLAPRMKCHGSGLLKDDQVVVRACLGVSGVFAASSARTG